MHAAQQDARFIAGTRDRIPKLLVIASQILQEQDERVQTRWWREMDSN
jgi:hypothetical protein